MCVSEGDSLSRLKVTKKKIWEWRCCPYNFIKTTYNISLNSQISLLPLGFSPHWMVSNQATVSLSLFLLWPGWPFICERESMDSLFFSFFSLLTGQNLSSFYLLYLYIFWPVQRKKRKERRIHPIFCFSALRSGQTMKWRPSVLAGKQKIALFTHFLFNIFFRNPDNQKK